MVRHHTQRADSPVKRGAPDALRVGPGCLEARSHGAEGRVLALLAGPSGNVFGHQQSGECRVRTRFKIDKPDAMEATLTVTATVSEWRELRDQLGERWPSWDFARQIGNVIRQAERVFDATMDA